MAPEQMLGSHALDRRADLYAVGVMLWEALTGRRMWQDVSDIQVMSAVTAGDLPRPSAYKPDVHAGLEEICTRALSPQPSDRSATAFEMWPAQALRKPARVAGGRSVGPSTGAARTRALRGPARPNAGDCRSAAPRGPGRGERPPGHPSEPGEHRHPDIRRRFSDCSSGNRLRRGRGDQGESPAEAQPLGRGRRGSRRRGRHRIGHAEPTQARGRWPGQRHAGRPPGSSRNRRPLLRASAVSTGVTAAAILLPGQSLDDSPQRDPCSSTDSGCRKPALQRRGVATHDTDVILALDLLRTVGGHIPHQTVAGGHGEHPAGLDEPARARIPTRVTCAVRPISSTLTESSVSNQSARHSESLNTTGAPLPRRRRAPCSGLSRSPRDPRAAGSHHGRCARSNGNPPSSPSLQHRSKTTPQVVALGATVAPPDATHRGGACRKPGWSPATQLPASTRI